MPVSQWIPDLIWVLMIKGILAISQRQDSDYKASCNVTCSLSTCNCELDGTISCGGRNISMIPSLPKCSTFIFLQNNQITRIAASDFSEKKQVRIIDLTNNKISELSKGIFDDLTDLMVLILHHNMITTVSRTVFNSLRNLTSLDLSHNQITTLAPDIFSSNPLLTQLSLHNNNISTLDKRWFHNNAKWRYLYISGNYWNCTCDLWYSYYFIIHQTHLPIQCNDSDASAWKSMCITCYYPILYRNIDLLTWQKLTSSNCAFTEMTSATQGSASASPSISNSAFNNLTSDISKTVASRTAKWLAYLAIPGVFLLMVAILGLAMWLGSLREKKRKRQSLLYKTMQRHARLDKFSMIPTHRTEEL